MRRTAMMMIVVGALIFALTAATAMAAPGKGKGSKGPGKAKVVLCHKGQTITVGGPAVKAHQKHGDTAGACAATTPPETTAPETTAPETTAPEATTPETTAPEATTPPGV